MLVLKGLLGYRNLQYKCVIELYAIKNAGKFK